MLRPVCLGLLLVLGSTAFTADPAVKEEWIPLFNGKNLDGWTPKIRYSPLGENYSNTFRVENGAIVVRYDGGG